MTTESAVDLVGAPTRATRVRWRVALSVAGWAAIVAVLAYVVAAHGHEIETAASRTSVAELILVTLLALLTLVARSEGVVACLAAMGARPRRRDIHAANSLTFVAAMVNHYLSAIVRAALIKRLDPQRAPTIPQMVVVDASTTLIEGLLVAVLIIVSASVLRLAWWLPVLAAVAVACAIAAAVIARRRFGHLQVLRGLDVLAHPRQRALVTFLMAVVIATQVLRTLLVLSAVGLHPSLLQAVATFVAAGVISSLLAGPGAGMAGAPLIIFGHRSLAAAAAAGLVLSIATLLASAIYAALGGPVFLLRLRRAEP